MSRIRGPERGTRVLVMVLLLIVAGGVFAALWLQVNRAHTADLTRLERERQGLAYVGALTDLTVELVQTRSAAAAGQTSPGIQLTATLAALSEVETAVGPDLLVREGAAELRAAVTQVRSENPTGAAAQERFSDLLVQANSLMRAVSAASQLSADPRADVRALTEMVTIHSPALVAAANQVADVPAPAGAGQTRSAESTAQLAVARDNLTSALTELTVAVRLAAAGGASERFVSDAARRLDQLQAGLAPLLATNESTGAAVNAANEVRQQAGLFTASALTEIQASLSAETDAVTRQQVFSTATAIAGVALVLVILWWAAAPPPPVPVDDRIEDAGVASVSVRMPTIDARDLLDSEELVHVGRGIRARPPDGANDAA